MTYKCLSRQKVEESSYSLQPIRQEDMRSIKEWRNDQMDILRQSGPLSDEDQERYWLEVISPGFNLSEPKQILLSFFKDEVLIGYGGLVYIDWNAQRAEVSFLLETGRSQNKSLYQEEYALFLKLLKRIAFEELHFHRLFTETFDMRPEHIAVLEKSGFVLEGRLKDHVKIGDRYHDSLIHGCLVQES